MTTNMRKMPRLYAIVATFIILGWGKALIAQISDGGTPYSFSSVIADSVPTVRMETVDVAALLAEDELEMKQGMPVPFRFGYPFDVSLGTDSALRT